MLTAADMHDYQLHGVDHVLQHPASGLLLDMGLGKTCTSLTAIDKLLNVYMDVSRVLVIAPKRVAEETWPAEPKKWAHLKHLRIQVVSGDERKRKEALRASADVYVIGCDNITWLVGHYAGGWPFDMVVIDESSKFKNHQAKRFKALRQIRDKIQRVVILTGTPAPNGLIDLWPQVFLLDQGERLGKTIGGYRERYFSPGRRSGHVVFDYKLRDQSEQAIYEKIADICISMKARDYLELPPCVHQVHEIVLPAAIQAQYEAFEREQVLALAEAGEISVASAAALSNKLLQFAGGAVYTEGKAWEEVHTAKLDALEDLVEAACGQPVLVAYAFRHELERILHRLKDYKPEELKGPGDIDRWNRGEIPVAVLHPASAGHGLNLQYGGHRAIWYGPTWNLEQYLQFNARLDRQGQTKTVFIHHLICRGTLDTDVVAARDGKAAGQDALMDAVKARVRKYLKTA